MFLNCGSLGTPHINSDPADMKKNVKRIKKLGTQIREKKRPDMK